ncbi:somatostatin receptor type 2-like [Paramacrobiotus metropolitanus]|uniref:somatostatin receptor type 2-like n=1 Tax=Paramacrobiotus metropolitanus TaxID=2943436 RepID=UPI0024465AC0|nr:somatostatin receptor type 2-like [Paramacrobiotus metropolitanus]XP_055346572.1 somatostatin receptor type 2-like [Paramacrobiotus metropolitanus]
MRPERFHGALRHVVLFYIISYPLLLTMCTVGNGLNLFLLIHPKTKKNTTNCYMTAMAIADIVFSWQAVLKYNALASQVLKHPYDESASKTIYPYMVFAKHWSMIFCDWVLVAFSVERFLAVIIPLRVKWLLRPITARIIIVALAIISGAFAAERFTMEYLRNFSTGFPEWIIRWNEVENISGLIVVFANFSILLLLDTLLIIAIRRQERSEIGRMRAGCNRYHNSNMIVLADVGLYLFSSFPTVILNCLMEADFYGVYDFDPTSRLVADRICSILHQCNYSLDFYLYLIVSNKYRKDFARVFGPICCTPWARKHWDDLKKKFTRCRLACCHGQEEHDGLSATTSQSSRSSSEYGETWHSQKPIADKRSMSTVMTTFAIDSPTPRKNKEISKKIIASKDQTPRYP